MRPSFPPCPGRRSKPPPPRLIRVWLVKKQRQMLVDFLNALGLPNNEGVVDDLPATMDDAKLKSAIETLLAKYPGKPWRFI